jgi:myo-inositol-1(or 4)-monophosphatase
MKKSILKDVVINAAKEGGNILMKYYKEGVKEESKGGRDIVTVADKESEAKIVEILKASFPDYNINSEEAGDEEGKSDFTWVIDPLDGTVNFASKNPIFCVSIALIYKDEVILSCVYIPTLNEVFFAERGKGAVLDDEEISVSKRDKLIDCINSVSPGIKTDEKIEAMSGIIRSIMPLSRSISVYGSTVMALAFVACGRLDSFVAFKSDIYNMASGNLLIKEAGGRVSDFSGEEFNICSQELSMVATNSLIHDQVISVIKDLKLG